MWCSQDGAFFMPPQPYMAAHMSADLPSCGDHNRTRRTHTVSCGGEAGQQQVQEARQRARAEGEAGVRREGQGMKGGYGAARTLSVASMSTSACSTGARPSE
jgi:hypothetical protein